MCVFGLLMSQSISQVALLPCLGSQKDDDLKLNEVGADALGGKATMLGALNVE